MKSINAFALSLQSGQSEVCSSSYDGVIVRWILGVGYAGRVERKDSTQIKCLATIEGELVTCGFDNKVNPPSCLGLVNFVSMSVHFFSWFVEDVY